MDFLKRYIVSQIRDALGDSPVLMLIGARQTGKSTLAQRLMVDELKGVYYTLDEATVLQLARDDPQGFIAAMEDHVVIDEIQRVPELLLAIKAEVDRNRKPGRFFLTGSADVLVLPRVSESLAGRMEILTLWPFSQGELMGAPDGFVDALFSKDFKPAYDEMPVADLAPSIVLGGYPEIHQRKSAARRAAWYEGYITSILQRDVRDIANIEGLTQMPRLLSIMAARSGGLVNYAHISRDAQFPQSTLKRYMALLEMTFLIHEVPAWSTNTSKRLVKSPKIYLCDTGLACHLLDADVDRLLDRPTLLGPMLETFVAAELKKQMARARRDVHLYHYRTQAGAEVDFVLEDRKGRIVGLEVKASATVTPRDVNGLKSLQELAGDRFVRGVILYAGRQLVRMTPQLAAVPIAALWQTG